MQLYVLEFCVCMYYNISFVWKFTIVCVIVKNTTAKSKQKIRKFYVQKSAKYRFANALPGNPGYQITILFTFELKAFADLLFYIFSIIYLWVISFIILWRHNLRMKISLKLRLKCFRYQFSYLCICCQIYSANVMEI